MAENERDRLIELLRNFDTAMLVTHAGNDRMHARPMAVAQIDDTGDLWFLTGLDTPKMGEIRGNDHVTVTFQDGRDQFIAVAGRAEFVRDRRRVDEIWRDSFKAWFPIGKDDPNLVLIRVQAQTGEYWDNAGADKMAYAFEHLGTLMSGNRPAIQEGSQHGKISI